MRFAQSEPLGRAWLVALSAAASPLGPRLHLNNRIELAR